MQDNRTADIQLIHIVCGGAGAGKTTYSQDLARELSGVTFSIDLWMSILFWQDKTRDFSEVWTSGNRESCESMIMHQVECLSEIGVHCVLDLGFNTKLQRLRYKQFAASLGATSKLHFLKVDARTRWNRVELRNKERPSETFVSVIERPLFDWMDNQLEIPTIDELKEGIVIER
jgi:predicted kinase